MYVRNALVPSADCATIVTELVITIVASVPNSSGGQSVVVVVVIKF